MCIFRHVEENIESVSDIDVGNSDLYIFSLCFQFVSTYWNNKIIIIIQFQPTRSPKPILK